MNDADGAADAGDATGDTAARVRRGLDYALLGGLVLLGLVAAIQFYFAADRTINVWVTREFRPPFKMVFNLVILLAVGVGLSRQIRRLTASDGGDGDAVADDPSTDATPDGGTTSPPTSTPEASATGGADGVGTTETADENSERP